MASFWKLSTRWRTTKLLQSKRFRWEQNSEVRVYISIKKFFCSTFPPSAGISPNTLREIKTLQHSDCEYVSLSRCDSFNRLLRQFNRLFRSSPCLICTRISRGWHSCSTTCLTLSTRGWKTRRTPYLVNRFNPTWKCFCEASLIYTMI